MKTARGPAIEVSAYPPLSPAAPSEPGDGADKSSVLEALDLHAINPTQIDGCMIVYADKRSGDWHGVSFSYAPVVYYSDPACSCIGDRMQALGTVFSGMMKTIDEESSEVPS